jgi:hypothetical protein
MSRARNLASTIATITAKGDLLVGISAGSESAQALGSNYQTLIVDTSEADGIRWGDDLQVLTVMGASL